MVKLYKKNISDLPDPLDVREWMEALSIERQKKILRKGTLQGRKECFGAGLLLKEVLEEYGLSEKDIYYTDKGKPMINGLYFNVSHSKDYVICAVADSEIGCDIEKIELHRFSKEFYRLWTIKESYGKMTGEGIGKILDSVEIQFGDEVRILRDGKMEECTIKEYEFDEYLLVFCIKNINKCITV